MKEQVCSSTGSRQTMFHQILKSSITLPSPPAIAVRVLEAVKKDRESLHDLGRIVSADPALTSKVLQVANSSIYGLARKVDSVAMALTVLGSNALKNIALSFVLAEEFKSVSGGAFDFEDFWRRSVTNAVAAEVVSARLGRKNEDTFVAALLQDVGYLVMFLTRPEDYIRVMERSEPEGKKQLDREREIFGFDHQELGAALLHKWGLPECLYNAARYHHDPGKCPKEEKDRVSILAISNSLSAIYWGLDSAEKLPEIQRRLADEFDLCREETEILIDSIAEKAVEVLSTFDVSHKDLKPLSQLLREANSELCRLNCSYEQIVVDLKRAKNKAENLAAELMRANEKLRKLALRDSLTGLYNHRHFHETLAQEMERSRRHSRCLSLILLDIDFFKSVNDGFGHLIGDLVLKGVAAQLRKVVRVSDFLARFGGEEFAVILPETNAAGLRVFGERVRRGIAGMEIGAQEHRIRVTVSVGGTTYEPGMEIDHYETMIEVADNAVYQSKALGRNRFSFFPLQDFIGRRPGL